MTHERDLFRAIVLAGAAVVGGCSSTTPAVDAATPRDAAAADDAATVADASTADANDDAFVAIL